MYQYIHKENPISIARKFELIIFGCEIGIFISFINSNKIHNKLLM